MEHQLRTVSGVPGNSISILGQRNVYTTDSNEVPQIVQPKSSDICATGTVLEFPYNIVIVLLTILMQSLELLTDAVATPGLLLCGYPAI